MWRLTEGGLLAAPLVLLAIVLVLRARGQEPSVRGIMLGFAALATLGAALAWFGTHADVLPPGTRYVPAELRDGEVMPGHGEEAAGTAASHKPRAGDAGAGHGG